jgi:GAF domain-containing protein
MSKRLPLLFVLSTAAVIIVAATMPLLFYYESTPEAKVAGGNPEVVLFSIVGAGITLLAGLLATAWLAAYNVRHQYDRLLYLHQTGEAMRATLDLTHVLEQLARDAALCSHADLAIATIVEEETDDLIVEASYDRKANSTSQHHRKVEEWYIRRCAATGEVVEVEQNLLAYGPLIGYEPKEQGDVTVVCAPILGRQRAIGVIMVVRSYNKGMFRRAEKQMVQAMALQAATAVEQAALFAKMRRYANEVELSYDTTLKVLIAALDQKDAVTQGHSERVSRLTVTLAREMGIAEADLVDIERGALLHDVGKIGVPDDILRKPDGLNETEWEAMRKHPLLAGLMVSKVEFLEAALPILLYHHERYDGSGYPFGLEGRNIPLEARIFTVVDSYDAMTSDRPYRKAMSPELALAEIRDNSGIQFDPEVVEAFTRIMERELELPKAS